MSDKQEFKELLRVMSDREKFLQEQKFLERASYEVFKSLLSSDFDCFELTSDSFSVIVDGVTLHLRATITPD
jgi:hypothetical protein